MKRRADRNAKKGNFILDFRLYERYKTRLLLKGLQKLQ